MIAWFLASKLGRMLASVLAALAVVAAVFFAGKREAEQDQKVENLQDYIDTNERVRHVEIHTDRGLALERLHGSGQLRD